MESSKNTKSDRRSVRLHTPTNEPGMAQFHMARYISGALSFQKYVI